jgi:hypothetical protein
VADCVERCNIGAQMLFAFFEFHLVSRAFSKGLFSTLPFFIANNLQEAHVVP